MQPRLYRGEVWHGRCQPVCHQFRYRHAWVAISLPQQDQPRLRLAPGVSWQRRCHGPRDGSALWPWLCQCLNAHGLHEFARVELHTLPAVLGYVFNPVSFYLVLDATEQLRAVWVEVSNTFGGHHDYCLHHPNLAPMQPGDSFVAPKALQVSPFFQVEGEYRFRFCREAGSGRFSVAIDYSRDGRQRDFSARQQGWPQASTAANLWRLVLSCALLTFAVWLRIHWQAWRLWCKGVPFFGNKGRIASLPPATTVNPRAAGKPQQPPSP
ncbi:DUF1365 domain-containing protein [Vogesella sp. LIG4]|uniref:DUF1365 domain-containing protein n=1 Tax=Vogesella sp. LIG4 TaxID=1192162 RepID=UPI00081F8DE0|nr:DUF1365 domain-containing protein [Vogesella sp. LIG4]SCK26072.1 hypothetical protein PSELUDRAFT_3127 [Vogesella sp. LIG4]